MAPRQLESGPSAPAGLEPLSTGLDRNAPAEDEDDATATAGKDAAPVVFTADDVTARPPDRPPTNAAPASEKTSLLFERS
ncbi:MAG: hypothetical protein ABI364_05460 [Caldimonas sp.]